MLPIWLSAFFLALVTLNIAVELPKQESARIALTAEVTATRILAYRQALKNYLVANPDAKDEIFDDQLANYWPTGISVKLKKEGTDPILSNYVKDGYPYVYTSSTLPDGTLTALWKKRRPFPVGKKVGSGASNKLLSPEGVVSNVYLPVTIPNNALVILM